VDAAAQTELAEPHSPPISAAMSSAPVASGGATGLRPASPIFSRPMHAATAWRCRRSTGALDIAAEIGGLCGSASSVWAAASTHQGQTEVALPSIFLDNPGGDRIRLEAAKANWPGAGRFNFVRDPLHSRIEVYQGLRLPATG